MFRFSHHIGNFIIPTDELIFHIFQRGWYTTKQKNTYAQRLVSLQSKSFDAIFFDPTIDAAEIPPLPRRIYENLLALHHILPTIFPSTLAKSNHSRIIPIVPEELSQYTPCCPKQCVLKSLISYRMGPPLDSVNRWLRKVAVLWFMLDITN